MVKVLSIDIQHSTEPVIKCGLVLEKKKGKKKFLPLSCGKNIYGGHQINFFQD